MSDINPTLDKQATELQIGMGLIRDPKIPTPSNSDLRAQTEPRKSLLEAFLENWHANASGLCALGCGLGGIWTDDPHIAAKFAASAVCFGAYFAGHSKGRQQGQKDGDGA